MKTYTEPMTIKEARSFVKYHFGNDARIPHGSKCVWVAGIQYITDQPGLYLVGATHGLCGVQVTPPVVSEAKAS